MVVVPIFGRRTHTKRFTFESTVSIIPLHPAFVNRQPHGVVSIRWYVAKGGRCNGRDFYEQNRRSQPSLRAQAQVFSDKGRLREDAGHYCKPPFEKVYEITQRHFRFFAFRNGDVFYITNGAKKNPKNQDPDRRFCEKCRVEFFSDR